MVNDWYQTNIPGYYAIGDVINTPASPTSLRMKPSPAWKRSPACTLSRWITRTFPVVLTVSPKSLQSVTEKAAKDAGYEIKVGKFPFTASGKAKAGGTPDGFVKVIFDAKYGEWLAHLIGANVTEMIAEVVTARKLETTGHEIIKAVHPPNHEQKPSWEAVAEAYGSAFIFDLSGTVNSEQ